MVNKHGVFQRAITFSFVMLTALSLTACPPENPITEPVPIEPTITPFGSSSPIPQVTPQPFPVQSAATTTEKISFEITPEGNLVSKVFKLNFGPGSKGFDFGPGSKGFEFGPGSKGFEFGPGSKGFEFGPGSKGFNLLFDIRYPQVLTRSDLAGFGVQQATEPPELSELVIEFVRDNQLYATATALPLVPVIGVPAHFEPGTYQMSVMLKAKDYTRQISWKQLTVSEDKKTTLKVSVFGSERSRPEDLDVELLTRSDAF